MISTSVNEFVCLSLPLLKAGGKDTFWKSDHWPSSLFSSPDSVEMDRQLVKGLKPVRGANRCLIFVPFLQPSIEIKQGTHVTLCCLDGFIKQEKGWPLAYARACSINPRECKALSGGDGNWCPSRGSFLVSFSFAPEPLYCPCSPTWPLLLNVLASGRLMTELTVELISQPVSFPGLPLVAPVTGKQGVPETSYYTGAARPCLSSESGRPTTLGVC